MPTFKYRNRVAEVFRFRGHSRLRQTSHNRRIYLAFVLLLAFGPFAAASNGESFEQLASQAERYLQTNRPSEAIKLYRECLRQRPSWGGGWLALGTIYYGQDRFPEAREALAKSAELSPPSAYTYGLLGLSEYETGDYEHALEHLRKSAARNVSEDKQLVSMVNFHIALLLMRLTRFEDARSLLSGLVREWTNGPALTEALGLASLRIPSLPREYPPERTEAVWLAGQTERLLILGDFEQAEDFANRLQAHYGQEANVHYLRGTLFQAAKRYEQAVGEFKQELAISPGNVATMLQLSALYRRQSLAADALAMARQAAELQPDDPRVCHEFGQALLLAGSPSGAIEQLEKARRLAPDDAAIRLDLAKAYKKSGRVAGTPREALDRKPKLRDGPSSLGSAPGKQERSE